MVIACVRCLVWRCDDSIEHCPPPYMRHFAPNPITLVKINQESRSEARDCLTKVSSR